MARLLTFGVKFRKNNKINRPRNKMDLANGHKYHNWREDNWSEHLHLDNYKRWQMGNAIVEYFKQLYNIPG
jgi:hypothetical protein